MRVAFVCVNPPQRSPSGGARRIRRTAELLASRGHEVAVYCARWWDDEGRDAVESERVTYRALAAEPSIERFAARLPIALRRFGPDVIHAAGAPPAAAVAAATGGRLLARAPVLVDWFGDDDGAGGSWSRRAAVRLPQRVFVPSRHVATTVRELGADERSIRVVPESVDVDLVRERPAATTGEIVTSRRLDEHANVETLLLALAELRDRDWGATVIGDGPERERYERQARDLRIDDRVSFPGALPLDERISQFKGAHVFVQTAERCPFATELLWALAAGCVGIVDYQAGSAAHELVEHRERGFLTTDGEELGDALVAAADIPHAETNDAFDEFDHRTVLERYLTAYRTAIGHGSSESGL